MFKKYSHFLILAAILLLYEFLRIKPLQYQTVGYTYDQGRDFLKTAEMVANMRPTFIGPTTGINGLYHGAWWYYVLVIPFLLFRGSPMGFYYFNFFIHLCLLIIFFVFVKRQFGLFQAVLFGLLIALSPYFTYVSLFVGNNIMVLPVMLGFLMVNFKIMEDKKNKKSLLTPFLTGVFLGLIGEFELSFGLFLIPTYFLGILIFRRMREYFKGMKHIGLMLFGLGIAFLPRILFELKNNFVQTKTLLSFFLKPSLHNPKSYFDVVKDRLILFKEYYDGLFPHTFFMYLISGILIMLLIYLLKNKTKKYTASLKLFSYVFGMLFFLSTLYRDNFWRNYYDGIQYIILFILVIVFSAQTKARLWDIYGKKVLIGLLLCFGLWQAMVSLKTTPKYEGLAVQRAVVAHIISQEKNKDNYCVRVYTPPVIPYTYDYLFLHEKMKGKATLPGKEWVNGTCWFIMEPDPFGFRLKEWRQIHEPEKKAKITSKRIQNTLINYYQIQ